MDRRVRLRKDLDRYGLRGRAHSVLSDRGLGLDMLWHLVRLALLGQDLARLRPHLVLVEWRRDLVQIQPQLAAKGV